jgi:AraC family transcriptional regulator
MVALCLLKSLKMQIESSLTIKGMVCQRCVAVIDRELSLLGLTPRQVRLGEVTIMHAQDFPLRDRIRERLEVLGFDLLEDRKIKMANELKAMVSEVYSGDYDFPLDFRFSDLVIRKFNRDYDIISGIFSLLEEKTLEKYIIDYRIQKVKEYLIYTSRTLADIAFMLNFSSVAHLARQFKQITGLTTTEFKKIRADKIQIQANAA